MTKAGLIKETSHDLNLNHKSCKYLLHKVPAQETLQVDLCKLVFAENWKYRSVISKLNFLALNSRPDITFAVHQHIRSTTQPSAQVSQQR